MVILGLVDNFVSLERFILTTPDLFNLIHTLRHQLFSFWLFVVTIGTVLKLVWTDLNAYILRIEHLD